MPVPRKRRVAVKKKSLNPHLRMLTVPGLVRQQRMSDDVKHGAYFLGLDPSLRGFGRAGLCENGAIVNYDTMRPTKLKGFERIQFLIGQIKDDLRMVTHCVTTKMYRKLIVVREDYAIHANDAADTPLKEFGGILAWELAKMGIPLYKLNITTIKKFATGKGNTDKDDVADIVNRRFGFCGDEDEAHAFCAALTAMAYVNRSRIRGLDKPMQEVIKSLEGHDLTRER